MIKIKNKYIDVSDWPYEKWKAWRYQNGFGGSDMDRLLDLPEAYGTSLELYLEYIGEKPSFDGNLATKFGHFHEPHIRYLYQFWDFITNNPEKCMDNEKAQKYMRKVKKWEAYCKNLSLPVFTSLDGEVTEEYQLGYKALLECKNTTKMLQRRYSLGYSPGYHAQVQNNLMNTGFPVAHIAMQLDGNDFNVVEVEPEKDWFELIAEKSHNLFARIKEARKIKKEYGIESYYNHTLEWFDDERQREGIMLLQQLEPEIDLSVADLSFVKEIVIPQEDAVSMQCTLEQALWLQEYVRLDDEIKSNTEYRDKNLKMNIIKSMGSEHNAIELNGELCTYKTTKSGSQRFYPSEKLKDILRDEERMQKILGRLSN